MPKAKSVPTRYANLHTSHAMKSLDADRSPAHTVNSSMGETQMKRMTFVQALRDYFGPRPGSNGTPGEFLKELQALTADDKAWFKANLATVGYEIVQA